MKKKYSLRESNLSKTIKLKTKLKELEERKNQISILLDNWKEDNMWLYWANTKNTNHENLNNLALKSKQLEIQIEEVKQQIKDSIVENKN